MGNGNGNDSATSPRPDTSDGRLEFSLEILIAQATVWLFCGVQLDGGRLERACTIAYLGWATGVVLIAARERRGVSRSDRQFVRWGWAVLLLYTIPAALWYWG